MPKSERKTDRKAGGKPSGRAPELFAYVRISTKEQNADRQLIALEPYRIPPGHIFIEKKSGKDFDRQIYKRMLGRMQKGDILLVKSVDRLGRDYGEIIEQWRVLTAEKGIDIKVLDMPMLDTTLYKDLLGTFIADLVLSVLSMVAQMERENTLQRQAEGIAAAKARGVAFGRKRVSLPEGFEEIFVRWRAGEITAEEAARKCGFSVRTLYSVTEERRKLEARAIK